MAKINVNVEEIIDLYINQNKERTEIMEILGIKLSTLKFILNKHNIIKPKHLQQLNATRAKNNNYKKEKSERVKIIKDKASITKPEKEVKKVIVKEPFDINKYVVDEERFSFFKKRVYNTLLEKHPDLEVNVSRDIFVFDFYIPSSDIYVDFRDDWMHGLKVFENTPTDLEKVSVWKRQRDDSYFDAIYIWTVHDPKKREYCKNNALNYVEYFSMDESTELNV